MIAELRPRSYRNYLELPLFGPLLDDFIRWSLARGYTRGTVKNQLKGIRQITAFLQRHQCKRRDQVTKLIFDRTWEHFRHPCPDVAGTVRQLEKFCAELGWFSTAAMSVEPELTPELQRFGSYLRNVRGLTQSTITSHCRYLQRFLLFAGLENGGAALQGLQLNSIENFVFDCSKTLNRHSLQHVVGYLRAFLRFLYSEGVLGSAFHEMLDTPRVYRKESLPRALSWATVDSLLNSIDRTDAHGIRNYAMLLLIATYGLRACEVVSLTLDDIRWRSGEMQIRQSKNHHSLLLPLTDTVANSLIDYLGNARPNLACREVFLRIRAPLGILKPTAVTEAFQREVSRSGLDIPYHGPHCLRHSYAVHLLRQGNSIKTIGDILGHRSAESTSVYLRLAKEDLRCVALDPPESVEVELHVDNAALDALPRTRITGKRHRGSPQSFLAEDIMSYLRLHRALGKSYIREECVLRSLDAFLASQKPGKDELDGECFAEWCATLAEYSAENKRSRMLTIRKFCLYRQRKYPFVFIPDSRLFPPVSSDFRPHILFPEDIGSLLGAASRLSRSGGSPLRPEVIHLAILLLFTTGLRRGELLRLTVADFDSTASTLFVRSTKFHKQRIVPLSAGTAENIQAYLDIRYRRGIPADGSSALIWNCFGGLPGRAYTGTSLRHNWRLLCLGLGVMTSQGQPPRIHDLRHSFAVNTLLRWYRDGQDVQARLPHLCMYMGHVNIASTQHYLHFIEPIRTAAGSRFEAACGGLADWPVAVGPGISKQGKSCNE